MKGLCLCAAGPLCAALIACGSSDGENGAANGSTGGVDAGSAGSAAIECDAVQPAPFPRFEAPQLLLDGLTQPVRVETREAAVYFTEMGELETGIGGRLARWVDGQTQAQTLFAGNTVTALFNDLEQLYFVERGTKTIFSFPIGGSEQPLTVTSYDVGDIERVGDTLYFSYLDRVGGTTGIWQWPLAGGGLSEAAGPFSQDFFFTYQVAAAGSLYISTQPQFSDPAGLAKFMPGGDAEFIVPRVVTGPLAADSTHVYFAVRADGAVMRQRHQPTCGSEPEVIAEAQAAPFAVATDGAGIYWTNTAGCLEGDAAALGSISGRALEDGEVVTIASGQWCPQAIAVDEQAVYWLNAGNSGTGTGSLMRARKVP